MPSSSSQKSKALLLIKYQESSDVFNKVNTSKLPKHRLYDCLINLQLGKAPPLGPTYNSLSPSKLKALQGYIEEELANRLN